MKNMLKLTAVLILFFTATIPTASAQEEETDLASFTFNIKGKMFSCVEGGALCRCTLYRGRRESYLAEEYGYRVEKYNPKTKEYTTIQTFRGSIGIRGSKFEADGIACEKATTEPHCLFQ